MLRQLLAASLSLWAVQALAADHKEFDLRNAQDLVNLCAVPDGDAMAEAGRSFCYGYLSGVYQYYVAIQDRGKTSAPKICIPDPKPSRAQAAALFVDWAKANGRYMQEPAVDSLGRFAQATWPCTKAKAKK